MVNFDFLEQQDQSSSAAASNSNNGAKEFMNKMALVPLTDFDTKTLALIAYAAFSFVFLCFVCCMMQKKTIRSRLERKYKSK